MDSVEEEHQVRRAEEWAQRYVVVLEYHYLPALLQNISSAPVWNRRRERGRR